MISEWIVISESDIKSKYMVDQQTTPPNMTSWAALLHDSWHRGRMAGSIIKDFRSIFKNFGSIIKMSEHFHKYLDLRFKTGVV